MQNQVLKKITRNKIQISTIHWIPGTNRYRYNFTSPLDLRGKNATLAMSQYSVYNCTYNISSSLGNNTYSVKWSNGTTYKFTIPDEYCSFSQLHLVFQDNFAKNKLYLQNTTNTSQVYYFIAISPNNTAYGSQIDISYIPNTLPTGYSLPASAGWTLPTNNTYPQLILSDGLKTLFGFNTQKTFPL